MTQHAFLLSGPNGLSAARAILQDPTLSQGSVFVVGKTPGLRVDFSEEIRRLLIQRDAAVVSESQAIKEAQRIICVGWRRMLRRTEEVFVVHDSLLPQLRGWNPTVTAIETGANRAGVTLFQASEEIDAGPIVLQKSFAIPEDSTLRRVFELVGESIAALFGEYSELVGKDLPSFPQNHDDATFSLWRDDRDYRIDWSQPALYIQRFVISRGWPYLGATAQVDGKAVRVMCCRVMDDTLKIMNVTPGKVMRLDSDGPVVVCGRGEMLKLLEVVDTTYTPVRVTKVRTRFS